MRTCGPNHGSGTSDETESDLPERAEVDATTTEERVEEQIAEGDEDDEGEGVEIREDVVGDAMERHRRGLRGQVVIQLVVCKP